MKSAFTVTNPLAGPTNGTIRFTNVIINIGGHYNTSTGKFICQYSGLYDFALHILKSVSSDIAYCSINKNHYVTVRAYTDPDRSSDSGYYMSSTSVVLHLVRGDVVNLEDCTPISSFNPYVETSFSGFLLKAD